MARQPCNQRAKNRVNRMSRWSKLRGIDTAVGYLPHSRTRHTTQRKCQRKLIQITETRKNQRNVKRERSRNIVAVIATKKKKIFRSRNLLWMNSRISTPFVRLTRVRLMTWQKFFMIRCRSFLYSDTLWYVILLIIRKVARTCLGRRGPTRQMDQNTANGWLCGKVSKPANRRNR